MHLVLDQNFPLQATALPWPPPLRLSRLSTIVPDLVANHDDWEILIALQQRGGVDGFVTNDEDMLQLPREMVALSMTRLALVVTAGVGNNAIRATGLLMTHLQEVAKRVNGKPQIFVLKPRELAPLRAGSQIDKLSKRDNIAANALITRERAAIFGPPRTQP